MYVIGLDLGISSLKGILLNERGTVVTYATSQYPLYTSALGYSEQAPRDWRNACISVLKELIRNVPEIKTKLHGISFSGQMHSLLLLDEDRKPCRNAILWNDVRTTEQCNTIKRNFKEIVDITKNVPLERFTLPKLLWVKENEPEVFKSAKYFILPKDYLGLFLTGTLQMDYSDAAGTLMLDVLNNQWSEKIAKEFGIPKSMFPDLCNSWNFIGSILPNIKKELGLICDVPIFAGGADNACSAIGAGIVSQGLGMVSIGSSGVFLKHEEKHNGYNGEIHYFNHILQDSYYSMGVTLSAGNSLAWFKSNFCENETYDTLLKGIQELPTNLFFTPYIMGERTPYADSKIRGSFIGIDTTHTKKHFVKAVLEGITFSLKDCANIMENMGNKSDSIVSIGGGAKSKIWLQMQADIFNTPVLTLKTEQGPSFGAAMIAAVGVGWFRDINECINTFVKYSDKYEPNSNNVNTYKNAYNIYKTLYNVTKDTCNSIY